MTRRAVLLAAMLLLSSQPAQAQAPSGSATARITAYCISGPTRSGEWTRPGVVAVDPSIIPLHSTVAIEGLGTFQALDTGGGVRGQHIDIFMPSCADAINWGVRYRDVEWW